MDKKKIFIVEDSLIYATLLTAFLNERFPDLLDIHHFLSGEECLKSMSQKPDLILMDYFLYTDTFDTLSGLETIKEIREINKQVKIVLLSGQENKEVAILAVKLFNCDYVSKDDFSFEIVEKLLKQAWH